MRKFENNEIGIGFNDSASEKEYKAAEEIIRWYFKSKLEKCFRDGFWVVAKVSGLPKEHRAEFTRAVNAKSSNMPNMQVVGPTD
jgi:hypothetical protein